MSGGSRNSALVNGALITAGVIAVVDNVLAHWILGLHRAVPGSAAGGVEAVLVTAGVVLLVVGASRESNARRRVSLR